MSRKMISIIVLSTLFLVTSVSPVQAGVPDEGHQSLAIASMQVMKPEAVRTGAMRVTVAAGDWLSKIAARMCGAASRWPQIARANPQIHNPDLIYPGQVLVVPCASDVRQTPPKASRSTPRPPLRQWARPLGGGQATSCYGWRVSTDSNHEGIDIPRRSGNPIYAVGSGVTQDVGRNGGYGLQVVVKHSGATWTRYAHASRLAVRSGQQVRAGQVIAYVGSTGNSTGPHLHFEVYLGKLAHSHDVNPAPWLRARGIGMGC